MLHRLVWGVMSNETAVFERTPPRLTGVGFFKYMLQKGNPGRRSHMRGFVRPHNILTAEALSLAAAVSASPTDRHAGVLL